jgi:dephospho-CoA kinase
MVTIGIVGGIASGKTAVAECFERLGAEVLQADRLGHEVLRDPIIRQAIHERWGKRVFDEQGEVDRAAIAQIVFGPPPDGPIQRAFLEQLTHPRITQRAEQRIAELAQSGAAKAVVLDAPLLMEAGWDKFCDTIVGVTAPRRERLRRAHQRGWTEADFVAREAAQESLDEKLKRADWVIDNSRSPDDTFRQVQEFWHSLD